MARALRRVLAVTAISATLLTAGAPAVQAAAPAAPDSVTCFTFYDPVSRMWWIICV